MSLRISRSVRRCSPARSVETGLGQSIPGSAKAGPYNRRNSRFKDRIRFEYHGRCLTPEGLVLRRWQDRSREATAISSRTRFDGCRLPPATWRVIRACLAGGLDAARAGDAQSLRACVSAVRAEHPTWRAPHWSKLSALLQFLNNRGVLERVVSAIRDEESPGIPDLFLYRVDDKRGVHSGRFVEVKRQVRRTRFKERLSPMQRQEHAVLRSLGLTVMVVYLSE